MSSIDAEILVVIYGLNSFKLYIINKKEILVRTDCEAIVKFHQKINGKSSNKRWWLNFLDVTSIYNITLEHIKGKDNSLADQLIRLIKTNYSVSAWIQEKTKQELPAQAALQHKRTKTYIYRLCWETLCLSLRQNWKNLD